MIEDNGDPYNPCSAAYVGRSHEEAEAREEAEMDAIEREDLHRRQQVAASIFRVLLALVGEGKPLSELLDQADWLTEVAWDLTAKLLRSDPHPARAPEAGRSPVGDSEKQ